MRVACLDLIFTQAPFKSLYICTHTHVQTYTHVHTHCVVLCSEGGVMPQSKASIKNGGCSVEEATGCHGSRL